MIRVIDQPRPCMMAIRLARSAPEVAARIYWAHTTRDPVSGDYLDRSPHLAAEINGEPADPIQVWTTRGRSIGADEYAFLLADRKWAAEHAPELPEANPRKPVILAELAIPFL